MKTVSGIVESVGLRTVIRLSSGLLISAPTKENLVMGKRVDILFSRGKNYQQLKEVMRRYGLAEALVLCYDPDADYSNSDFIDFEILEPPSGDFWNPFTGVIGACWFEDDPELL